MDYIRFSISNPVKVTVAVMLLLLFGLIAIWTIPVQLVPNVDQPIITVATNWVGRSPEEVEREIIEKQEDKIKSVSGLRKMTAVAQLGRAQITLEFYVGTDMTRCLQDVTNKLNEVESYADEVDRPVITLSDAAEENAIAWMILTNQDPSVSIEVAELFDLVDKRVKPYLERVSGLSQINVYGGRERQAHIRIDPRRMAERGITFNQLSRALQLENVNISAGDMAEGQYDVRVRTIGQYDTLDAVRRTIVAYAAGGPVRVSDLGEVALTLEKRRSFVRAKGEPSMAINAIRESGSNVMAVMDGLRQRLAEVNATVLPQIARDFQLQKGLPKPPKLHIEQVYDETVYISDALQLVLDNLWQGGVLTIIVLLLFLRSFRNPKVTVPALGLVLVAMVVAFFTAGSAVQTWALAALAAGVIVVVLNSAPTLIIALSIPTSIIGTFLVMIAFGRNLNVVSLAGLAFAVGMVVDNAIVVLENTDRHLQMGKNPRQAAYDAAKEVWLALIASTMTTLVVFLPVLTLQEEAGQLFYDISLAIMASVGLSLIVAVTVIPSAAARWLQPHSKLEKTPLHHQFEQLFGLAGVFTWGRDAVARFVHACTTPSFPGVAARVGIVGFFTLVSVVGAYLLMPPTTYLPQGNRNLVFGIMLTPPGYNMDQNEFIGQRIEAQLRPYWEATSRDETAKLPPALNPFDPTGSAMVVPPIENYFFVSFLGNIFMGASSAEKEYVSPLGMLITGSMAQIPGAFGFAQQASLFGRGLGGANSIDVEIAGDDIQTLRTGADALYQKLVALYGPMNVRPDPLNFNLAGPELQVRIDRVRAADLGIDVASLGLGIEALVDGAVIGDYRYAGESIDLVMIRDPKIPLTPDRIGQTPVAFTGTGRDTAARGVIPLSAVADFTRTSSPQEIKRIEQRRAISFVVTPPPTMPLQTVTEDIDALSKDMQARHELPPGLEVGLAGTADKLTQVRESFLGQWHGWNLRSLMSLVQSRMFLALLINYLVMAALFESFLYPFVIMFSVPLATIGGFLGLRILHTAVPSQLLDVVTMLGFVILIGTVVNNAILIVAQALNFMRGFGESELDIVEKMPPREAIRESVRTRLRPVMMTTITTLFGMLPLVIKPGSGSELYRGLGAVVLGGLLISTLFTLLVVPLVFSLVLDLKIAVYRWRQWPVKELGELEPLLTDAAANRLQPLAASPRGNGEGQPR